MNNTKTAQGATLRLPLGKVRPGMLLGTRISDERGVCILDEGTLLSGSLLAALAKRGIENVEVRAASDLSPLILGERETELARRRVLHLFRHSGDDAVTQALAETMLDFRTGRSEWSP